MSKKIVKGHIIFTSAKDGFEVFEDSYMVWKDGKILGVFAEIAENFDHLPLEDYTDRLIIPGFVDLHLHAPQYPNRGLGYDEELIPWLDNYTFPMEARYGDLKYADKIFTRLVKDLWRYGTTSAAVFSSVHKEGTKHLLDLFIDSKLRAFVGKVNMDRNTSAELLESSQGSVLDTEEIIVEYEGKSDRVKPIITPRFVPTCTEELMGKLGELAVKYKVPIQSHLNENKSEVEWVRELHPEARDYASVYNEFKLFGSTKTIMAHCIYNTEDEISLMAKNQVYAAHCPHSNYNLMSGIMPVRKFLEAGVPVGLGSDIAGGHSLSMPNVMVAAIQASKMKCLDTQGELKPLTCSEAFFLATKGGGSFFGKVGSFEEGYAADALVIDDNNLGDSEGLSLEERVQRFIYIGDDRNIVARYVGGEKVKEPQ